LAEITPPTGFKISADIDEYYLGRVKAGQHADIDLNGTRHALRIARIYPEVKNGVFKADLGFEGAMPVGLSPRLRFSPILRSSAVIRPETGARTVRLSNSRWVATRLSCRLFSDACSPGNCARRSASCLRLVSICTGSRAR
ncbi:MAG: HlyD family secretion protein, partial [Alphaproteobacteria bacterium]|nr:HlyD family secretion protein [Alphaproteobacteria bacterium]